MVASDLRKKGMKLKSSGKALISDVDSGRRFSGKGATDLLKNISR
jgi:hypothetical protein